MRRRVLILAAFLLAGAVVNVAVAWGCAMWTIRERGGASFFVFREIMTHPTLATLADHQWLKESGWKPRLEDGDFVWKAASREISGFGLRRKAFFLCPDVNPGQRGTFAAVVQDRSRWPLPALHGELWLLEIDNYPNVGPRWFFESRFAIAKVRVFNSWYGSMIKDDRLLAYLPVWPGFVINALFYAAILWLLTIGPFFALRRLIRHRRGLCLACGYDLRHAEHEACPECGVTA